MHSSYNNVNLALPFRDMRGYALRVNQSYALIMLSNLATKSL